jgi:hypothetical protein
LVTGSVALTDAEGWPTALGGCAAGRVRTQSVPPVLPVAPGRLDWADDPCAADGVTPGADEADEAGVILAQA